MLRKENETVGEKVCLQRGGGNKKETNMYVVLSVPDTVVAQWEQDEQGKSLFWKETSRGGVYTRN